MNTNRYRRRFMPDASIADEFRAIYFAEGYLISRNGQVWSCRDGKIMSPSRDKNGYQKVNLYIERKLRRFFIHRLVATAFIGPAPEGSECCHNDGDLTNNNVSNLRWDTTASNQHDKVLHGRSTAGSINPKAKLTDDDVRDILKRYRDGEPPTKIASCYGLKRCAVWKIGTGRAWRHLMEETLKTL